jgi:Fic family protein
MNLNHQNWGELRSGHDCDYYLPSTINHPWTWDHSGLDTLIEQSSLKLGELNGYASLLPDIETITTFHRITEALSSYRLTGRSISLKEILMPFSTVSREKQSDRLLVDNYINTLIEITSTLRERSLSLDVIRNAHQSLYTDLLNENLPEAHTAGNYRNSHTHSIPDKNSSSGPDSSYTPPDPVYIPPLMHDLERFIQNRDQYPIPEVIRTALIYYQLMTIQPFSIGNGKLARMITLLFMTQTRLLSKPILNLSRFFENNRSLHDQLLISVREEHDMISWIKFFLMGIELTATDSINRLNNVFRQKKDFTHWINTEWGRRSGYGITLLNTIYAQPMIDVKRAEKACGLTPKAAGDLIRSFIDAGILTEITGQARNRIFLFEPYLEKFTS